MLKTAAPAPDLTVPLAGRDGTWSLRDQSPDAFTMIVFYRGRHCPICKKQLAELSEKRAQFEDQGVEIVCISMDDAERVRTTLDEWNTEGLTIGHGMTEAQARSFGLYISKKEMDAEPERFSEPGLVLVRPDGDVYAAYIQSVPFGRPDLDDLASGIAFILKKDYPTRGTA